MCTTIQWSSLWREPTVCSFENRQTRATVINWRKRSTLSTRISCEAALPFKFTHSKPPTQTIAWVACRMSPIRAPGRSAASGHICSNCSASASALRNEEKSIARRTIGSKCPWTAPFHRWNHKIRIRVSCHRRENSRVVNRLRENIRAQSNTWALNHCMRSWSAMSDEPFGRSSIKSTSSGWVQARSREVRLSKRCVFRSICGQMWFTRKRIALSRTIAWWFWGAFTLIYRISGSSKIFSSDKSTNARSYSCMWATSLRFMLTSIVSLHDNHSLKESRLKKCPRSSLVQAEWGARTVFGRIVDGAAITVAWSCNRFYSAQWHGICDVGHQFILHIIIELLEWE